jgi:predicted CoA-substrate-specific enzyme activase
MDRAIQNGDYLTSQTGKTIGVDVGSCATKAVVLGGDGQILGSSVVRTGIDLASAAQTAISDALSACGVKDKDAEGIRIVSTGFGRKNVSGADASKTEIACHARGCYSFYSEAITVVDIGGQDSKVIRLDASGRRLHFKMNRKCAAGTGAFLEEIASRLEMPIDKLNEHASAAQSEAAIGSYCTVFAATEILSRIRAGADLASIVRGVFSSVVNRILEMDPLEGKVVLTGGVVAHNPFLVEMISKRVEGPVVVPPEPQLAGAIGAAFFARDKL